MSEDNTEAVEADKEPVEVVTPEQTPIKSKKSRSDLQKQALENARQKSYKQAAIKNRQQ